MAPASVLCLLLLCLLGLPAHVRGDTRVVIRRDGVVELATVVVRRRTAAVVGRVTLPPVSEVTWNDRAPPFAVVKLWTRKDFDAFAARLDPIPCIQPSVAQADLWFGETVSWEWPLRPTPYEYVVALQMCTNSSTWATSDIVSVDEERNAFAALEIGVLLTVYIASSLGHFLVFLFWTGLLAHTAYYNGRAAVPALMWGFSAVMIIGSLRAGLATSSSTIHLVANDLTSYMALVLFFITDVATVACLLLLCTGYTTTRRHLSCAMVTVVAASGLVRGLLRIIYTVCLSSGSESSCQTLGVSDNTASFVVSLVACGLLFKQDEELMRMLRTHRSIADLRAEEPESTEYCSLQTLLMLRDFRWPLALYASFPVFSGVLTVSSFAHERTTISSIVQELANVYLYIVVAYNFWELVRKTGRA